MADENMNLYNILTGVIKVDQTQNEKISALNVEMQNHQTANEAAFDVITGVTTGLIDVTAAAAAADATAKADAALASGKAYTVEVSGNLQTTINGVAAAAQTALEAASGNLQAYADKAEADAISTAKGYTDTVSGNLQTAINGVATAAQTALETASGNLQAYADQAEADALSAAKAYTDDEIDALKEELTEGLTLSGVEAIAIANNEVSLKIDGNDNVLTQSASGLMANIQLVKLDAPLSSTYAASYQLQGVDGAVLGAAINIPKDQLLKKAEFVNSTDGNDKLQLTFIVADGSQEVVDIDLSGIIDDFSGANGIVRDGWTFKGVVDGNSEGFLTVGADGFKLAGVQTAIDTAAGTALTNAKAYTDVVSAAVSGAAKADIATAKSEAIASAKAYTDEQIQSLSGTAKTEIADALSDAKDYTDTASGALDTRLTAVEDFVGVGAQDGQSLADKVTFISGAIGDGFGGENTVKAYVDQAEADALKDAKAYTDDEITAYDTKFAALATSVDALLKSTAEL